MQVPGTWNISKKAVIRRMQLLRLHPSFVPLFSFNIAIPPPHSILAVLLRCEYDFGEVPEIHSFRGIKTDPKKLQGAGADVGGAAAPLGGC